VKIRILVAVDRDGMDAATMIYEEEGFSPAYALGCAMSFIRATYDIDASSIQWRIVEAEVPGWQETELPVVQGEVREVGL
jgi:hypothetical protein